MLTNFKTRLLNKTRLTSNILLFRFQLLEPQIIDFQAGQYLILKINDQCRLYSICSPDFIKNSFELVVEIVRGGLGSSYFDNLKMGDSVNFQGPAGLFTIKNNNLNKIFLATGSGIAPIRSMIYTLVSNQFPVFSKNKNGLMADNRLLKTILFWGLRTKHDLYFFDELKKLAQENVNFQFKICLSREKDLMDLDNRYFMLGHINDGFLDFVNTKMSKLQITNYELLNSYNYYLCGGRDMVSSMVTFLQEQGIKKENIFFEKF